jgi:recombination associated protein RdgC
LEERSQAQETQRLRKLKRSEKAKMAEEIEFELLPKAFRLQKRQFALLDSVTNRLIINTSSHAQAEQFTALLRKTLPGISITPLDHPKQLESSFSDWLSHPNHLPASLKLAADCVLFSPDNEKKRINCRGCELPAEEILSLLNQGFLAQEISLQWNERVQFTLTQSFTLKRIKCLDFLLDDFNALKELDNDDQQQLDAALALLSGELRALITDLFSHFTEAKTAIGRTTSLHEVVH